MQKISNDSFKLAMSKFSTGIAIISTKYNNEYYGFTAYSVSAVSLNPPLLLFCIDKTSKCLDSFVNAPKFALSILNDTQVEYAKHFALRTKQNKFAIIDYILNVNKDLPLIPKSLCTIECKKFATYPGGDHIIIIGNVIQISVNKHVDPLIYYARKFGKFNEQN